LLVEVILVFIIKKQNMKKLLIGTAMISSIILVSCSGNNTEKDTTVTDSKEAATKENEKKIDSAADMKADADFAVKIADAGMLEVALGKVALKNASSPKVKEFAQMMIDDHTKANAELMDAAKKKNITLPAVMSDKHQQKYNDLAAKKGKDFDKDYMAAMVDGHQDVLDEMKKEADKGNDADLKMWAAGKIATIQHHLDVAKSTKDLVK
jgi:putative membrane protein